jgi:hypothetical protein
MLDRSLISSTIILALFKDTRSSPNYVSSNGSYIY